MHKFLKRDLERIIMDQLENLNTQSEHILLIKEQNELLVKYNHKLIDKLSDKLNEPKPYPVPKRKTMNTKEIVIHLIKEDMRFNQYIAALRKLGIEAYCFDLDLTSLIAKLMGHEMTNEWIGHYVLELLKTESLPVKPLGNNLYRLAEECYNSLLKFKNDNNVDGALID